MIKFSVVIPVYNKAEFIENTLDSVFSQTYPHFEVIAVNDGSTDGSLTILEKYRNKGLIIINQENQGVSIARNTGVDHAQNEYIALIDADDIWLTSHLEEHAKSIKKFPEADLYCNAYKLKLQNNFKHNANYSLVKNNKIQIIDDYFKASLIHPIAWTSTVVFTKKVFKELGGFDKNILSGQDFDLWIRFGIYKKIVFNPAVTSCYDKTIPESLSKENHRKAKFELFNGFQEEEKNNSSLKKYLDLNRYSIAIHCKYHDDTETLKKFKGVINQSSLNLKQKLLLNCPSFIVRNLKKFHSWLIKNGIYLTSFN